MREVLLDIYLGVNGTISLDMEVHITIGQQRINQEYLIDQRRQGNYQQTLILWEDPSDANPPPVQPSVKETTTYEFWNIHVQSLYRLCNVAETF